MKNLLGIRPYAFEPSYSEVEGVSDSKDSEENSDSERVGNTDWCGCEVCVCLSQKECICYHEWDIPEERLEVEDDDCVTHNMDPDLTCMNPSVLATSYVAFLRFKGIGARAPSILNNKKVSSQ